MKLTARATKYSSVVGGGLQLHNEKGQICLLLAFIGARGLSKEQDAALSQRLVELINEHGLICPDK